MEDRAGRLAPRTMTRIAAAHDGDGDAIADARDRCGDLAMMLAHVGHRLVSLL
jgi:hypothetical protein